jgi:hypothetical protein
MGITKVAKSLRSGVIKLTTGLVVAAALPFVGFTGTAQAAVCQFDYLCMYMDVNFGGPAVHIYDPDPYGGCFSMPGGWNDIVSSVNNNSRRGIMFYQHGGCTGAYCYVPRLTANANVHIGGCALGDQISSYDAYLN